MDLSQKKIYDKIEAFGFDVTVYSLVHKQICVRSQICRICGFDGASVETCNIDGTKGEVVTILSGHHFEKDQLIFCQITFCLVIRL